MNNSTIAFIHSLGALKDGDLGILRQHRGSRLDESLPGFDLFSGLWWPLRSISPKAPRREVAWLIAKLFAEFRFQQLDGETLPLLMGRVCRKLEKEKELPRMLARFDQLLTLEVSHLEPALAQVLAILKNRHHPCLDWVALTDDLSAWEQEAKREQWTNTFMKAYKINKEDSNVD